MVNKSFGCAVIALSVVAIFAGCATTTTTSAPAQPGAATATSGAGGAGAANSSDGPPCKYLASSDLVTVLPGALSTSTRTGSDADLCNWVVGKEMPTNWGDKDLGLSLQVVKTTKSPLAADKKSVQDSVGDRTIPHVGDFAGFVKKQSNPSVIEFIKGDNTVLITFHKSAPTSPDYDALVTLAKKVAAQL